MHTLALGNGSHAHKITSWGNSVELHLIFKKDNSDRIRQLEKRHFVKKGHTS